MERSVGAMNYVETMEYINSFTRSGKPVKDLSRVRKLLDALGNPQDSLKFVHVAGTNGKGSTVEMVSNALVLSGYRVGTFTSPYMFCYEDRIRVDSVNVPKERLCEVAQTVKASVDSTEYSQFEISMAIAFLYYKSQHCDIVVLETGIGGALDSTNVVENTLVSVITSISLDHTAVLGDTLSKVATQKAGIIKRGKPVILSGDNFDPDVVGIVSEYAKSMDAKLTIPKSAKVLESSIRGQTFSYDGNVYKVKMLGRHQVYNATTVIETCKLLNTMGFSIPPDSVKESLERTQVPFRTELIRRGGVDIIADGSHNLGGVLALKDTLKSCNLKDVTLLVGMVTTKDYESCCKVLSTMSENVICTDGFAYNSVPKEELATLFDGKALKVPIGDALKVATSMALENGSTLTVCGSLYLMSEIFAQV